MSDERHEIEVDDALALALTARAELAGLRARIADLIRRAEGIPVPCYNADDLRPLLVTQPTEATV